jgi:hypothetical protein
MKKTSEMGRIALKIVGVAVISFGLAHASLPAAANGLGENSPWRFRTDFERAARAAVVDLIERKQGGYYDGFTTVVNNVTTNNVGTQINCNNGASAIGNEADNGIAGNAPTVDVGADNSATSVGNNNSSTVPGEGGQIGSNQDNSGAVSSGADGNVTDISTGNVNGGNTDAVLNNDQVNSGNQSASVSNSTACGMDGASFAGMAGTAPSDSLTGPLN